MDIEVIEHILPFDEAVSRIRKSRKTTYIKVGSWASFTVQNPTHTAAGIVAGTNGLGVNLQVTRAQAVQFLHDTFPAHWRAKISVRVAISKRCMFVGSGPR